VPKPVEALACLTDLLQQSGAGRGQCPQQNTSGRRAGGGVASPHRDDQALRRAGIETMVGG
jgi:hypothetical protein